VHYFLKTAASGPVALEVVDPAGTVVRRYRSDDIPEPPVEGRNIPTTGSALHRCCRGSPACTASSGISTTRRRRQAVFSYPIAAIVRDTPREPRGPWAVPGTYTIRSPSTDGR
jgi:hypothetical protein